MICQSCGTETEGLHVNDKIFCGNCGAELKSLVASERPVVETIKKAIPKIKKNTSQRKKIISTPTQPLPAKGSTFKTKEEELDLIKELSSALGVTQDNIQEVKIAPKPKPKPVVEANPVPKVPKPETPKQIFEHGYRMVPGEPDIVQTPEIEPPGPEEDSLDIKDLAKEEVNLAAESVEPVFLKPEESEPEPPKDSLDNNQKIPEPKESTPLKSKSKKEAVVHGKILAEYLKNTIAKTKLKKSDGKPHRKKIKKLLIIVLIIAVTSAVGAAFVFYVNSYVLNPGFSIKKAEDNFGQSTRFEYIPPGYEASYQSSGSSNQIDYIYEYAPDISRRINIVIKKSDIGPENIFEKIIKPNSKTYEEVKRGDHTFWIVDETKLYFAYESKIYEIYSSSKISTEELLKIAQGIN